MKNAEQYNAKIIFIEQYTCFIVIFLFMVINGFIRPNLNDKLELLLNQYCHIFKYKTIRN